MVACASRQEIGPAARGRGYNPNRFTGRSESLRPTTLTDVRPSRPAHHAQPRCVECTNAASLRNADGYSHSGPAEQALKMAEEFFADAPPSLTPVSFDASRLEASTDSDLDQLPFGVIALDARGIVLRYNLFESRLARLDSNQVLGRSFFQEVAPCTRSADFEGRFKRFVATGTRVPERFEYLFDFKFGAQAVVVELVRPSDLDRYYLLINRTHFGEPRPDGIPAPIQSELAPDEASAGVRRDATERRVVQLPSLFFAGLKATCERLAPQTWPIFCHDWGVEWGRRAAIDLETHHLETDGALRDLSMNRVAEVMDAWFREQGLGRLSFDFAFSTKGCLVVELERSVIAEAVARPARPPGSPNPTAACSLIAGCLSALLSHVGGRRLSACEYECCSSGSAQCSFMVVAHARAELLETLVEGGLRDARALAERLSPTARG